MAESALRTEVNAAEAEIAAGHAEEALAHCQALLERFPRALILQRVTGEAYLALRKPREALGALERALAGDPEDARACCARALIHQIHGDSTAALAWYRRACEIRPEDAMLRQAYGELATHLGEPPYAPSTVGLARLYLRGDLFIHAQREWEAILAQQPDRLDAQVGLAETLWRAGNAARASEVARHIITNASTCVKALLIVGVLEHADGNADEADRLLLRAAELDPERRIGEALFADLFAAGDIALEGKFNGYFGIAARTTAAPAASLTGPLGEAARDDLRAVDAFAQSRITALPPDFHQIFAETEYMLWGRDEEETRPAMLAPPVPARPAPEPEDAVPEDTLRLERAPRSRPATPAPPPALASAEGGLEDTEARLAIGWVRWLRAQGARPIEGDAASLAAAAEASGTAYDDLASLAAPGASATAPDLAADLAADGERTDGDGMSPTTLEALERQFAASGFHTFEPQPGALAALATQVSAAMEALHAPRAAGETYRENGAGAPDAPAATTTPATEAADERDEAPADAAAPAVLAAAPAVHDAATPLEVAVPPTPDEPAAPAADDYLGRLRLARRRRAEGRIEAALHEYRGILHDAPDMLDDLVHDLRDLSTTTEDPEVHRLLGDTYIREGDYIRALESYNRALALSQRQVS